MRGRQKKRSAISFEPRSSKELIDNVKIPCFLFFVIRSFVRAFWLKFEWRFKLRDESKLNAKAEIADVKGG